MTKNTQSCPLYIPLIFLLVPCYCATMTKAETISINLNNGQFTLLEPMDVAGVIPANNWNNFANNGGLGLVNLDQVNLVDDTGAESGATIIWQASQSAFNSNNGAGSQRMMEGWYGLNAAAGDFITIDDLPPSITDGGGYDVYVYFDSDQVAPSERTMNFSIGELVASGTELPVNYPGEFTEASDGSVGNYVVFRGLVDSMFTLTGVSDDGGVASVNGLQITTDVPPDPNSPIHQYNASQEGNTNETWQDATGGFHWTLANVERTSVDSRNTNITTAYRLTDLGPGVGGDTNPFPAGNVSYELWVRPGDLNDNHQVIFETGGGQNGTSILMTEGEVRLLNSSGNARGFDVAVPLAGSIDASDFIQIVAALNPDESTIDLYVNGSAGGNELSSANGTVGRGGNRASLFTWGSGLANAGNPDDAPGGTFNLGGRTELDEMTPQGLTQFMGDIALMNVYSRTLTAEEVFASFSEWLSTGDLLCDFNSDGLCDISDIDSIFGAGDISAGVPVTPANSALDLTGDNIIDQADVDQWLSSAATANGFVESFARGDANLDGTVNANDLNALALNWQQAGALWSTGDFTGEGNVNPADLNALGLNWQSSIAQAATVAVPEPSTISLSLALILLCGSPCRRRYAGLE